MEEITMLLQNIGNRCVQGSYRTNSVFNRFVGRYGKIDSGVVGIMKESTEARKVKKKQSDY